MTNKKSVKEEFGSPPYVFCPEETIMDQTNWCDRYLALKKACDETEPIAYAVLEGRNTEDSGWGYIAGWPEACHEHINDAINEHSIEGAGKWRVVSLYEHPIPIIANEQKPVAFTNSCELEYLDFKRADGGLVIGAMWKEWDEDAGIPLFTSPPNTADIEQRVAEAIAHWIRCGDHHGVITSADVLAGKWRKY